MVAAAASLSTHRCFQLASPHLASSSICHCLAAAVISPRTALTAVPLHYTAALDTAPLPLTAAAAAMTNTPTSARLLSRPARNGRTRTTATPSQPAPATSVARQGRSRPVRRRGQGGQGRRRKEAGEDEDGSELFVVEAVRGAKVVRGVRQFLVEWQGYKQRTWEPQSHLPAALIADFDSGGRDWTDGQQQQEDEDEDEDEQQVEDEEEEQQDNEDDDEAGHGADDNKRAESRARRVNRKLPIAHRQQQDEVEVEVDEEEKDDEAARQAEDDGPLLTAEQQMSSSSSSSSRPQRRAAAGKRVAATHSSAGPVKRQKRTVTNMQQQQSEQSGDDSRKMSDSRRKAGRGRARGEGELGGNGGGRKRTSASAAASKRQQQQQRDDNGQGDQTVEAEEEEEGQAEKQESADEWEIEAVVDSRTIRRGETEYRLKWKRVDTHENGEEAEQVEAADQTDEESYSWVKARDCYCEELIAQYKRQQDQSHEEQQQQPQPVGVVIELLELDELESHHTTVLIEDVTAILIIDAAEGEELHESQDGKVEEGDFVTMKVTEEGDMEDEEGEQEQHEERNDPTCERQDGARDDDTFHQPVAAPTTDSSAFLSSATSFVRRSASPLVDRVNAVLSEFHKTHAEAEKQQQSMQAERANKSEQQSQLD